MQCREVLSKISAYADGELSHHERREIETHITKCSNCARVAKGVADLQTVITDSLRDTVPSPDLVSSIMAEIPADYTQPRLSWRWAWAAMIPAAAALAWFILNTPPAPAPRQQVQRHVEPERITQKLPSQVKPTIEPEKEEIKQQASLPGIEPKKTIRVIRQHRSTSPKKHTPKQRRNPEPVPNNSESPNPQPPAHMEVAKSEPPNTAAEGPVIVLQMADISVTYKVKSAENPPPPPREHAVERPPIMPEQKDKFNIM